MVELNKPAGRVFASSRSSWEGSRTLLVFLGLYGLGITLPLLDLYGTNPEVFIANRSSTTQIVAFALMIALGPAALTGGLWWLARATNKRFGKLVGMLGITVAGFLVISSLLRHVMDLTNTSLVIAIVVSLVLGYFGQRKGPLRDWFSYLVLVPAISLISFLVFSDSAELLWEEDARAEKNARIANPIPIVMLVLDELPMMSLLREDGKLNDSLFPNFTRVKKTSYWFRNFATNSIATHDSIPIILSGVLNDGAKPTSSDHPNTIFTLLGESYAMYVNESVSSLCPDSICKSDRKEETHEKGKVERTDGSLKLLLKDAQIVYGHLAMPLFVRDRLPSIDGRWGGFLGELETSTESAHRENDLELPPIPKKGRPNWINNFLNATDQFSRSEPRSLHYTHLLTPHIPWRVNPSGSVYRRPEQNVTLVAGVKGGYWLKTPPAATQGLQRHFSQLGAVDKLLGYYIKELKRSGLWDEALLIITADHGANFKPGSHRRWVMGDDVDGLYRVPLFIHLPGQETGVIRDEPAFSIDILPTIIDILGISVDWPLTGLSLLGNLPTKRPHVYDHYYGKRIELDMRLESLWREVSQIYNLIPDTSSWETIAEVGSFGGEVGKQLTEVGTIVNESIIVSFDDFEGDVIVDQKSGVVPTLLTGQVSIPTGFITSDVLVAVNETIQGVGYTNRDIGDIFLFSVYVPESAFRQGINKVELVIASETGDWHSSSTGSVATSIEGLKFGQPLLSSVFTKPKDGFKAPPFNPGNAVPPKSWEDAKLEPNGRVRINLQPPKHVHYAARYIYVPIISEENRDVELLIGSDDTLEVWFEGKKVLEHKSPRAATLGDNSVMLQLKSGVNHLYFRVDNLGGAWWLLAAMNPSLNY